MSCGKHDDSSCGCLSILVSLVLGVIVGVLTYFVSIPFLSVAVWIALGLSALFLVVLVAGLFSASLHAGTPLARCICSKICCLLLSILGTMVCCVVALTVSLISGVIWISVLMAIGTFFFALMLIQMGAFLCCIGHRLCVSHEI